MHIYHLVTARFNERRIERHSTRRITRTSQDGSRYIIMIPPRPFNAAS